MTSHHTFFFRTAVLVSTVVALFLAVPANAQVTEKSLPGNAFSGLTPGPDGRLYGVTYGTNVTSERGKLYSVDPALSSVVTHVVFNGAGNGDVPYDELVWDQATGKFYGTATREGPLNRGTVFSYVPGSATVTVLRSDFGIGNFGTPRSSPHGLVIANGFIYGLAEGNNDDLVFRMAMDGSGFVGLQNLNGGRPQFLTLGPDGKLYGETIYGGSGCPESNAGCGSIFRIKAALPGDIDVQYQILRDFHYYNSDSCPGNDPYCVPTGAFRYNHPLRLIFGSDGLLYGTTYFSIFKLDPNAPDPSSTFQFIWTSGGGINLNIIEGSDGKLYAADYGGGANGAGQVFSINRDGTGFTVLRTFNHLTGTQAYGPYGRLYRNPSGIIYGTTEYTNNPEPYTGTVYSLQAGPPPAPPAKLKVANGNLLVGSPGEGLILKSPGGTTCVKIAIDNSGLLTNAIIPCP